MIQCSVQFPVLYFRFNQQYNQCNRIQSTEKRRKESQLGSSLGFTQPAKQGKPNSEAASLIALQIIHEPFLHMTYHTVTLFSFKKN